MHSFLIVIVLIVLYFNQAILGSDLLSIPPPIIYRNGPGRCSSNLVKCKEIARLDWCIHFCLFVVEGYLMLNVSFSVWAMKSDQLSFELGAIEDDIESKTNPPTMTGDWDLLVGSNIESIHIAHFRYSTTENVHFFRFEYADKWYSGNIMDFDEDKNKFSLFLYEESRGVRTANSLKGWMDLNGTSITWTSFSIQDVPVDKTSILFADTEFKWPRFELPRSRGCYNYGPLDAYTFETVGRVCGKKPDFGGYDGQHWNFSEKESAELDRQLNDGESPCPVCDVKQVWREYYACSQRFKSMKAEANRCQQMLSQSGLSALDALKWICQSRLQLCVTFRTVTFSATKIEICPVPSIRIIMDDKEGYAGMSDATIPEANPVIFGCIDFPVTTGVLGQMNERMKAKFVAVGKKAKIAWYVTWWEYGKIALFTIGGILFIRWLLKRPPADQDEAAYEEFDDAKFFEEYGDFYSEETEEEDEDDLYDDMF
eukprot:338861_1